MFTVISDLSLIARKELEIDLTSDIYASGVQGRWVTVSSGKAALATSGGLAWPVFNESNRDQSVGNWAPDVKNSKKVTVLAGKGYFARTTEFVSTSVVEGAALKLGASGKLVFDNSPSAATVAYCTVAPRNIDYLGTTVSVIDIYVK